MSSLFSTLIYKEWLLAIRKIHEIFQPILFLIILSTLFSIALGPDNKILPLIAPSIIWVSILLSLLLSHEHFYKSDFEDGSLEQFFLSGHSKLGSIYAKLLVHWILQILPIILATPILALFYQLSLSTLFIIILTLLLGSPSLLLLSMFGAAITLSIKRGGLLLILIILPLYIPILIFALACINSFILHFSVIGELSILSAVLILSMMLIPFAIIAALSISLEN